MTRGIRGATTAANTVEDITVATQEMLKKMVEANGVSQEDITAIFFTMTEDLDAVYPAKAARQAGYTDVPLMCYQELSIQNSLDFCIRALMLIQSSRSNREIKHVYLKGAQVLRPDLLEQGEKEK